MFSSLRQYPGFRWAVLLTVLGVAFAVLAMPRFLATGTRLASQPWTRQHSSRLRDPFLSRYYVFTGSDAGSHTRNLATWTGEMCLPTEFRGRAPRSVPGREDALRAVRIEDVPLQALPASLIGNKLTVEFRIRHYGQGFVLGGNLKHSGTLVAMGDGIWNGFLFSMQFPANTLSFQLGHPKPSPALPVMALSRLPSQVWTHIAGTWDGQEVCIYVNGLLAGRRACSGPWFPVPRSSRLRVGYTGNGLGCIRFDIEQLALYARCLSDQEILDAAWPNLNATTPQIDDLLAAGRMLVTGAPDAAESRLQSLHDSAAADSIICSLAELRLGECHREAEKYSEAELWFKSAASALRPDEIRGAAGMEIHAIQNGLYQPSSRALRADSAGAQGDTAWLVPNHDRIVSATRSFEQQLSAEHATRWSARFDSSIRPILQQSCVPCHHSDSSNALNLASIKSAQDAIDVGGAFWREVAENISTRHSPPLSRLAITPEDHLRLLNWVADRPRAGLCEELSEDMNEPRYFEDVGWRSGFGSARRLTRSELRNSIRDLFGVLLSDEFLPPPEGSGGEGFDTSSGTLFTSSSLLESWLQSVHLIINQTIVADQNQTDTNLRRILTIIPRNPDEYPTAAKACLEQLTRRAWRRVSSEVEMARLMGVYTEALQDTGDYSLAVGEAAKAVLLSPAFLFVVEPETVVAGEYPLLPEQLATRMALFLWSSLPDEELLNAALSGRLSSPGDIRAQIRRMLRDPRSAAIGDNFGLQWLGLVQPESLQPHPGMFRDWTPATGELLRREAARFVAHVLCENRPITELLNAEYVLADKQLAEFYGLRPPTAAGWHLIPVDDGSRGGLLGLGAVLTATSRPGRTSPVLRGRWILENILGETVQPPPPDVPALPETADPDAPLTLRERLEQHRSDPACAGCHQTMDQLGFGLEEFDPTGRLRSHDSSGPVNASGTLPTGEQFNGISGLRSVLKSREPEFLRLICRRLLGYALGRELERFDLCVVDRCVAKLAENQQRADVLFEEIIMSFPFRYRQVPP